MALPESLANPIRVLLVEDDPIDAGLVVGQLRQAGVLVEERVVWAEPQYREALKEFLPDVILCDFAFPDFDGPSALQIARSECPHVPFIFVTDTLTEENLVVTLQSGAVDYVLKSNLLRLPSALLRAVAQAKERQERQAAEMRVARLRSVRDVFAAVNAAIVRQRDHRVLFKEVCGIATRVGNLSFATIVLRDHNTNDFEIVAYEGVPIAPGLKSFVRQLSHDFDGDAGAIAAAIRRKAPVVENDFGKDLSTGLRSQLSAAGVRAVGSFPLIVEDSAVGVLMVASRETGYFDYDEVDLLSNISTSLSFVLSLFKEQQRVTRLSRIRDVLSAVNEAIVRINSRDRLIEEVCRIAFETASYVDVFITSFDPKTEHVHLSAAMGAWTDDLPELERALRENVRLRRGVVSLALRTSQPAFINDIQRNPSGTPHPRLLEEGVRAVGAFPLILDGRVAGTTVFETTEPDYFDGEEIQLLTSLTNNLAFALDHIDRQGRVTRLSRIRSVLSAVNAAIVRFSDRDELFREVCRVAVEAGGFMNVFVAQLDPETRRAEILASLGESDREELERSLRLRLADTKDPPGILESSVLHPVVRNDIPPTSPPGQRGVRSAGSFPLVSDGRGTSSMIFETHVADYFDDEEIELLSNLASNLSFGLNLLEKQRRLTYLSLYDVLTQLPNRTLFYERLAQDLAAAKQAGKMLGLVLLDVVRFSALNNTLGEHVGDEALRMVAQRLRAVAEESRIGRIAGDRFALCFPMLDDPRTMTDVVTAEGLTLFEVLFQVRGRDLHIMARAGCAVAPADGENPEELFRNAEAALQKAKATGSAYCFYAPDLNARLAKELDIEARLQRALDEQQFALFYQPQVTLQDRRLVGFEALIRWNDPERGFVQAGEFIPMLERTGIIVPVGRWVLCEAARQYEEWKRTGLSPPRIAVNLSVMQLRQDRLVDDVRAAVELFTDECGLDAEVTESMLMDDFEGAIAKLTAIRDLGVNLALDDFGTGYSSLSYIHQLPLNALKIDRSFVLGLTDDPNKTSIISTIISLGQALRLSTIAEGVEREEEAQLLHLLHCDQAQGYLFGKPMPVDVAARFLAAQNGGYPG